MTALEWWPAPAKLNLFLHITGRRADGYHLLQTVFQFLDWGDRLAFEPRNDGQITYATPLPGVPMAQDLVVRAAHLLQQQAAGLPGVTLHLDKRLALGAGLGGGSSDAATTLLVLNELWQLKLDSEQLSVLGLQLGADVPVFIQGHAAWAEGIGERLQPIELPEWWYLVITPPCQVATGRIFSDIRLKRDCQPITIDGFLSGQAQNVCENVCEPVACRHFPQIRQALDWLDDHGSDSCGQARMTGTGASVFMAFAQREAAERAYHQLPDEWQGFVAQGLNRSPLFDML